MPTTEEIDQIVCWRLRRLLDAGFPMRLAEILAIEDVDLHEALELIAAGCPPETTAKILI